jgi:anti-sigma factor RsiW
MKCKYLKLVSRYADNELPLNDKALLEKHLSGCPVCEQELKVIRSLKEKIPQKKLATNTEFFWQQLRARIAQEEKDSAAEYEFNFGNWAKRLIPVPVIAALAAVIVLNIMPVKVNPVDEYLFSSQNSGILDLIEEPGNQSGAGSLLY